MRDFTIHSYIYYESFVTLNRTKSIGGQPVSIVSKPTPYSPSKYALYQEDNSSSARAAAGANYIELNKLFDHVIDTISDRDLSNNPYTSFQVKIEGRDRAFVNAWSQPYMHSVSILSRNTQYIYLYSDRWYRYDIVNKIFYNSRTIPSASPAYPAYTFTTFTYLTRTGYSWVYLFAVRNFKEPRPDYLPKAKVYMKHRNGKGREVGVNNVVGGVM